MKPRAWRHVVLVPALYAGLVVATVFGARAAAATNLMTNGGLEQLESNGYPSGWKKFCEDTLSIDVGSLSLRGNPSNSLISPDAHSGKNSLWINIPAPKPEIGGWAIRIAIKPKTIYHFSCWAKVRGKSFALVALNEFKADGKTRSAQHTPVITSENWQQYDLEFESHPGTVGIQIVGTIWESTGQAWFDDFSLQEMELSEASATKTTNDETPFTQLTTDVVTSHISWANPYAMGPIKVLAIPGDREVVELAQRLSIDFSTWTKMAGNEAGGGNAVLDALYYGPRDRGTFTSLQTLKAKLNIPCDVILIGTLDWPSLPTVIKNKVLSRVQAGTGLVFIRPPKESQLESFMEKPVDMPTLLSVGVPYAGLTVLDRDVQGKEWLKCFTCGQGRVAIVDYQHESFSMWECERSFRRGMNCPFTPDVSYDYRAKPLSYEYYQSLLARLVTWAARKEGTVALAKLAFTNGRLQAGFANTGAPQPRISAEVVVRDPEGCVETTQTKPLDLAAGQTDFDCEITPLKSGSHFADLWLKKDGKILAWGSVYFQTTAAMEITAVTTTKFSYRPEEIVEGTADFNKEMAPSTKVKFQLIDSLGRLVDEKEIAGTGTKEISFQFPLKRAVAVVHSVKVSLLDGNNRVTSEKSVDIICRRSTGAPDDFHVWFWAGGCGINNLHNRYMLADLYRRGFDTAYCSYIYAPPADQLTGLFLNTARQNFNLGTFSFNLGCWYAGSDPTAVVSARCETAPGFRENLFNVLRQHASIGRDYPVYAYSLGDESGLSGYDQDFCFSPTCLEFTRNYLKGIYGNLDALNREWGTKFAAWEEVKCMTKGEAQKHGNFAPWVDLRMAMEEMWAGLLQESGEVLRKEDPSARTGFEGMHGGTMSSLGEDGFVGYDFGRIVPRGNFWGPYFQFYPHIEFVRSFAAANTILQTYTEPFEDYPKGYYEDKWHNEKVNRFVPWYDLFNGMNSIHYWGAMNTTWYGFYSRDFRPTPWAEQITGTIREIKGGIGKLLLGCRRENNGIAIFYSQASLHAQTILGGKERLESPRAFCNLLEDLGFQYDFISREQMTQGKLAGYKALILPYSRAISGEEAAAIKAFAGKGGFLIADGEAGVMDGHGRYVKENMLSDLKLARTVNPIWQYREVRNQEAGSRYRREIAGLLGNAGIKPRVTITPKKTKELPGCEIVEFTNGPATYLGILQGREYLKKEAEDHTPQPVTITLPGTCHVYSIREGRYLGFTNKIETGIEPAVAKLYALLPAPAGSLLIEQKKRAYAPGETVDYTITTRGKLSAKIPRVYRVEISRPDATLYQEYARNISAGEGKGNGSFPLALNDPSGTWKITVTDVAVGVKTSCRFTVKKVE